MIFIIDLSVNYLFDELMDQLKIIFKMFIFFMGLLGTNHSQNPVSERVSTPTCGRTSSPARGSWGTLSSTGPCSVPHLLRPTTGAVAGAYCGVSHKLLVDTNIRGCRQADRGVLPGLFSLWDSGGS